MHIDINHEDSQTILINNKDRLIIGQKGLGGRGGSGVVVPGEVGILNVCPEKRPVLETVTCETTLFSLPKNPSVVFAHCHIISAA